MKILHISDTHGKHRELGALPAADVLVHSGDFTLDGKDSEALDFIEWLCDLPYENKIFIAGNHDMCMYDASIEGLPDNVHYLADTGVVVGNVFFYGIPLFYGLVNGKMQEIEHCANIPDRVDVLITHRPPLGLLDGDKHGWGSTSILSLINDIHPRLHLFGHAHNGYGTKKWKDTIFSNASLVDNHYNVVNTPQLMAL